MRSFGELVEQVGARKLLLAVGGVVGGAALLVGAIALTRPSTTTDTTPIVEPSEALASEPIPLNDDELTFDSGARPVSTDVRLKTPGVLTACVDSPFPPFLYSKQSDGEDLSGIDVDLITALATNNQLTPAFVETPFDGVFDALDAGTCDVIASSVAITDDRKRAFDFTEPYFTVRQSVLMRSVGADGTVGPAIRSLDELRGKNVVVQTATPATILLSKAGVKATEYRGRAEMIKALDAGTVDAIVADSSVNGFDAHESDGAFVVTALLGDSEHYGFVVAKDNPVLTSTLDASLARLRDRGLLRKVLERYLPASAIA
jgi:ABC-type amino acid transport substrate-binding protein